MMTESKPAPFELEIEESENLLNDAEASGKNRAKRTLFSDPKKSKSLLFLSSILVGCLLAYGFLHAGSGVSSYSSLKSTGEGPGVSFPPMLNFINESAGAIYPDNFPDCLFVLKQTMQPKTNRTKYVLEQSMNSYWKHAIGFRRVMLKLDTEVLEKMVEKLNLDAPAYAHLEDNLLEKQNHYGTHHAIIHQRIHDAGGSFPFYTHWKVIHPDASICENPSAFPIFRRAIPIECGETFSYWTIPTAPILKQIKTIPWAKKLDKNLPRENLQKMVVVATIASEVSRPNKELEWLRDKGRGALADKLHFLPVEDIKRNFHDEQLPENSGIYKFYTAALDIDHTSSLYPSLLCKTSVLMKRHPAEFIDMFTETLEPWVHYVPVKHDLSDVDEMVKYVLDPKNAETLNKIVKNANAWCSTHMNMKHLSERILQGVTTFIERLDYEDESWTRQWRNESDAYLAGHWLRQPGGDSWTLPVSIVAGIKDGLRADDPKAMELADQPGR